VLSDLISIDTKAAGDPPLKRQSASATRMTCYRGTYSIRSIVAFTVSAWDYA
jgi:hypothetical protein